MYQLNFATYLSRYLGPYPSHVVCAHSFPFPGTEYQPENVQNSNKPPTPNPRVETSPVFTICTLLHLVTPPAQPWPQLAVTGTYDIPLPLPQDTRALVVRDITCSFGTSIVGGCSVQNIGRSIIH